MSKKAQPIEFVNAPLHELLKHSNQVTKNMEAEQFEAEREEAAEKFGFITEEQVDESRQGNQPQTRKNRQQEKAEKSVDQKELAKPVSGEVVGAGGQAGTKDESVVVEPPVLLNPTVDEEEPETVVEEDEKTDPPTDLEKNPWD